MRVLCVGRHPFLSEHLGRYFEELGVDTTACVGMDEAARRLATDRPDAIVCDYDLLTSVPRASWPIDPDLSPVPLIVVSLTRHANEAHLPDSCGIAGFLYLPTLDAGDAHRVLSIVRQQTGGITPPPMRQWPETTQIAQRR